MNGLACSLFRLAIDTLLDEIARWQGGEKPLDDISILSVELSGVGRA